MLDLLEKKIIDIKEIILVKEQSKLALEIIRRNNIEIIRNLDRINNVTIVALNTAVTVAKSLYNQKIVLNKIQLIEKENKNITYATTRAIIEDGEKIYNTAINNNSEEALKIAFANVNQILSNVDAQNKKAFPENEIQIIELKKEIDGDTFF